MEPSFTGISQNLKVLEKFKDLCREFSFQGDHYTSTDDLTEEKTSQFLALHLECKSQFEIVGQVQVVRHFYPSVFICLILREMPESETIDFLKKSGCNFIISEDDLYRTSKLEYLAFETIRSEYLPIKTSELMFDMIIPFDLYLALPANSKFLKILNSGDSLTEGRIARIQKENELFVSRRDLSNYNNFIKKLNPNDPYCRARNFYLSLRESFREFAFYLLDQNSEFSYDLGKEKMRECQQIGMDLVFALGNVAEPYKVVDQFWIQGFGSLDRVPAITALSGISAINSGIDEVENVLVASLVQDLGLLMVPYKINQAVKTNDYSNLSADDKEYLHHHAVASINLLASKRVPLNEATKKIILNTHELINGKGYPNQPSGEKIPIEAQLLNFMQILDYKSLNRLGSHKKNIEEEKVKLLEGKDFSDHYAFKLYGIIKS